MFYFNDSMHSGWHGLHKFVQNQMTHVTPALSDSDSKSIIILEFQNIFIFGPGKGNENILERGTKGRNT